MKLNSAEIEVLCLEPVDDSWSEKVLIQEKQRQQQHRDEMDRFRRNDVHGRKFTKNQKDRR